MLRYRANRPGRAARSSMLFVVVIAAALMVALSASARAADHPLSEQDNACLNCHGFEGTQKKATNGDILSLHIPQEDFAKSVHSAVGCSGCHADVTPNHPSDVKGIAASRAYSIEKLDTCRTCHDDKFKQWEGSIHASLVRDGNPGAPICTDCHNPHAVIKGSASSMESVPCKNCHSDVYDAYANSVHGKLRSTGQIVTPLCAGCHAPHAIRPANLAMGNGLDSACTGCHADLAEQHKTWHSALHLEVVSCPACHAPGNPRRLDLKLINDVTQARVSDKKSVPQVEGLARAQDIDGKGFNALELWGLLRTLNAHEGTSKIVLRGRLEMKNGADAHKLVAKSQAVSDCNTCHRKGAEAFQAVTLSILDAHGLPIRFGAGDRKQ